VDTSAKSAISIQLQFKEPSAVQNDLQRLTLYVIRHGECEHNVLGRAAARDDTPLTERGREQARANGRLLQTLVAKLDDLDFYASSLHRACVTMEIIRETIGLPPYKYRADRRLMEGDLGDHTWLPAEEMLAHPGFVADPWNYVRPDGESQAMVHARVGRFLATLRRDSVIVAHALSVNMIRAHYLKLTPEQLLGYPIQNSGIIRLSDGVETPFRE
jgi:probable phosphoglycerate mutase